MDNKFTIQKVGSAKEIVDETPAPVEETDKKNETVLSGKSTRFTVSL